MSKETAVQPSLAKKALKVNKKVGKMAKGVPDVMAYATEVFLTDLVTKLTRDGQAEITLEDIAKIIEGTAEYDFLLPLVPEIRKMASEAKSTRKKKESD
jgi:hypothetical protein